MIPELAVATALLMQPASDHQPQPSRSMPNRWMDSGVSRVWANAPKGARDIWLCIRRHESLHAGHYTAVNGSGSSATGAGQWLGSTWRGVARWVPEARGYRQAKDAPAWVQDLVFLHVYKRHGLRMWHGTWCPGT